MRQVQRRAVRGAAVVAGMVMATALVGCGNFFVCDKASCANNGGGGSTGPAGDVAYVGNNATVSTTINGYTLAKPTLTATTSSPYPIGNTPTAMVMSHANGFLYESSVTNASLAAGIYGFTVGTGGALSVLNVGNALETQGSVAAMDVSPDGQWLVVTSAYDSTTGGGAAIVAYPISSTTGLITKTPTALTYFSGYGTPVVYSLKVAPSGDFITVALGSGGIITFPFNTSTGAITTGAISPYPTGVGAQDVAIDSNNLLYVAATGDIYVYTVTLSGTTVTVTQLGAAIATSGAGPFSIALDGTSYVYAAYDNLIYAFSNKAGVLTKLSPATISAPSTTTKIGVDSTGAYLLAAGYDGTAGLEMYTIASGTGVLTSVSTAPTGTPSTAVGTSLALSH